MTTAADLAAYREGLLKALGSGTLTVIAGGVTRTFRSVAEIQRALAALDRERQALGGGTPVALIRINSSKGL